jgi:hypothetical protein
VPGLVPGIQPTASAGASGELDSGDGVIIGGHRKRFSEEVTEILLAAGAAQGAAAT